jgi:hypothetical protein
VAKSIITFWIFFLPGLLNAQFSANGFIGSARNDLDLKEIYKKLDYLGENKISSPAINRAEFRLRTRDLNFSPDDYRLRIYPTNPLERSMNKQYHKIQVNSLNNDLQFTLNTAIKTRYRLLINYICMAEKLQLIDHEIQLENDEITVLKEKGEFETLDVNNLLDCERKLIDLEINKTETESRLEKTRLTIKGIYEFKGNIEINIRQLIGVEQINSITKEISYLPDTSNIYLTHAKTKYELKESKYKVDLSESSRNLGFIETQYRAYRGNNPEPTPVSARLGFEIGIRIPLFNPDRADNARSYLNLLSDYFDLSEREKTISEEEQFSLINLLTSISKYQIINTKIQNLFPDNSFEYFKKYIDKDPDKLLNIKNSQIKMNMTRLECLEETYSNFIDLLDVYGKLSEAPLKNYLVPGLDEI